MCILYCVTFSLSYLINHGVISYFRKIPTLNMLIVWGGGGIPTLNMLILNSGFWIFRSENWNVEPPPPPPPPILGISTNFSKIFPVPNFFLVTFAPDTRYLVISPPLPSISPPPKAHEKAPLKIISPMAYAWDFTVYVLLLKRLLSSSA